MKILAPAFILLTLLAGCYQKPAAPAAMGHPQAARMGAGHESGESAAMEAVEGPGR
jgi:hypothetical protein